jgi:hypothetical protein
VSDPTTETTTRTTTSASWRTRGISLDTRVDDEKDRSRETGWWKRRGKEEGGEERKKGEAEDEWPRESSASQLGPAGTLQAYGIY